MSVLKSLQDLSTTLKTKASKSSKDSKEAKTKGAKTKATKEAKGSTALTIIPKGDVEVIQDVKVEVLPPLALMAPKEEALKEAKGGRKVKGEPKWFTIMAPSSAKLGKSGRPCIYIPEGWGKYRWAYLTNNPNVKDCTQDGHGRLHLVISEDQVKAWGLMDQAKELATQGPASEPASVEPAMIQA